MSAVTAIYHIVINTYRREMTLPLASSDRLYRYIGSVIQNTQSTLYAINGIENHIHLLINLHPSVRLADLIRDIKLSTTQWIKQNREEFPQFAGWGKEYGAFTYALRDKERWLIILRISESTISESTLKTSTANTLRMPE